MSEIEYLRSEYERLQDLMDRRPAINAGIVEAYIKWTALCYQSDAVAARWVAEALREVQPPAEGAH
jgi:hypothetical protein